MTVSVVDDIQGPTCNKLASKMLEQLDLTERPLGEDLLTEDIGDLLDSNTLVRLRVCGRTVGVC